MFLPIIDLGSRNKMWDKNLISLLLEFSNLFTKPAYLDNIFLLKLTRFGQKYCSTRLQCVLYGTSKLFLISWFHDLKYDSTAGLLRCHKPIPYPSQLNKSIARIFWAGWQKNSCSLRSADLLMKLDFALLTSLSMLRFALNI